MDGEGDDLSGSVIAGRYALRREIGRGGTATLYLATDLRHDREVAVKVLRHELTGSIAARRFTSEIATAARLSHPLIVPLHDSGEWEGRIFFVMQYVEGDSLRRHLDREGRLKLEDAIDIACEVAEALEFAHRRGIVHRDIKPANILLHAGHAAVADFGIALALDRAGEGRLTAGFALGTPRYMSPEQTYGDRELDARSDVYSLGCVLYEMLAGAPPFNDGGAQAIIVRHRDMPPPPLRRQRSEVSPALEEVVMRSLAKEPADRFANAKEFEAALMAARSALPHSAEVNTLGVRGLTGASAIGGTRNRRIAVASVAGVLAVLLLMVAATGAFSSLARTVRQWFGGEDVPVLDRQLVTVAPFYVPSANAELQEWKDALAHLIATSLDGAGPLRASSVSGPFGKRLPVSDRDSATAIGRRTGAGFVIWGTVLDQGPQMVRVSARVLDVAAGRDVDEVDIAAQDPRATASQLLARMVDSLQVALLRSLGTVTRVAAVRRAGIGCPTSPPSAKRRYLQGEQFYRQNAWDSAEVAYTDVLAADPRCALAYHRLADVSAWVKSADDSMGRVYQLKAAQYVQALGPRDSLLITADSLDAALRILYDDPQSSGSQYWAIARRLFDTLAETRRRYPGDPELWYALGDARYHWGWGPTAVRTTDITDAFDTAIQHDSGFAHSYLHAIELAFWSGDTARGREYVTRYHANRPAGMKTDWVDFTMRLIDRKTAFAPDTRRSLETLSDDDLLGARIIVERWPDSLETAVRISWQMATRGTRDSVRIAECAGGYDAKWVLAQQLALRGHLRASACALGGQLEDSGSLVTELALLGAIPPDTAERVFGRWLRTWNRSLVHALPWWSARRDSVRLTTAVRVADSVLRVARNPAVREQAVYIAASARAHLALARNDAGALAQFRALSDTLCIDCFLRDRWTTAQLLAARDSLDAAYEILSAWPTEDVLAREVPMALDRGRVAERLGRREEAIAAYRFVVAAWERGDEAVQWRVEEARRALGEIARR